MLKIYLNASNQGDNIYSYGNTSERVQMEKLAKEIVKQLQPYNVQSMVGTKYYIADKATEAKAWGADFSIALHSNAGNVKASGAIAFYNPNYKIAKELAVKMVEYVDEANPGIETHSRVVGDYNWLDVSQFGKLGIPSMLFETTFHDNPEEALWIVEHTYEVAAAIVKAIVEVYSLKFKDAFTPAPEQTPVQEKLWRVQVGAFKEWDRMYALEKLLLADGFSTYLVEADGFGKVQVEALRTRAAAEILSNKIGAIRDEKDQIKYPNRFITDKAGNPIPRGTRGNVVINEYVKKGDRIRIRQGAVDLNTKGTYFSEVYKNIYIALSVGGTEVIFGNSNGVATGKVLLAEVYKA